MPASSYPHSTPPCASRPRTRIRPSTLTFAASALLSAACSVTPASAGGADAGAERGGGLGAIQVPTDFMFQATRPVDVTLGVDTSSTTGERIGVELRTESQALLFRGSVIPNHPLVLRLPLSSATTSLSVTVRPPGEAPIVKSFAVDPDAGRVALRLVGE